MRSTLTSKCLAFPVVRRSNLCWACNLSEVSIATNLVSDHAFSKGRAWETKSSVEGKADRNLCAMRLKQCSGRAKKSTATSSRRAAETPLSTNLSSV